MSRHVAKAVEAGQVNVRTSDLLTMSQRASGAERPRKVAYIMSRFPKLTETFVLYEMIAVEEIGHDVEVFPLQRERTKTMHPEAAPLVARARFAPLVSRKILSANFYYLTNAPKRYLSTLWTALRGNVGSARYFFGALGFLPKIVLFARQMECEGVDWVHAHFASHPALAAFVVHGLTGIPYSFTAHGSDLHRDQTMLTEKVEQAEFVATVSQYNRNLIARVAGEKFRDKVHVVHCGVDTDVFRPKPRLPEKVGADRPLAIGCIGTLHEVKGQRHLLDACRALADRDVDFVCHIVGDGPDRHLLERQIAELRLGDRVQLRGKLLRAEISALLDELDVVVAPSVPTKNGRKEGIPVVLMEAISAGLPVIGSRITGVPELVEDGRVGFVCEPGDSAAIADGLERLALDSELRRSFGYEARAKAVEEFDLYKNAIRLADFFVIPARYEVGVE